MVLLLFSIIHLPTSTRSSIILHSSLVISFLVALLSSKSRTLRVIYSAKCFIFSAFESIVESFAGWLTLVFLVGDGLLLMWLKRPSRSDPWDYCFFIIEWERLESFTSGWLCIIMFNFLVAISSFDDKLCFLRPSFILNSFKRKFSSTHLL